MSRLPTPVTNIDFQEGVRLELRRARMANPDGMHSLHEAHSIILEEVEEFWDQVKLKASKRDHANVFEELIQIAAMAQRAAEDLGYVVA
jgi:hypothetical protein